MNSVLITGAAGFVGSHLSDLLLGKGYSVVGIDDFSAGTEQNLTESRKSKNFKFHKTDVTSVQEMSQLGQHKFDAIIHEAAWKIPKYGNALRTLEVNSIGTRNALELARKNDSLFVFASTSDVYGKNTKMPFNEEADLVLGPPTVKRWAYAASKIYDEHLIYAYREAYGLNFVIVRYFNSYGPRLPLSWYGGPILAFLANIAEGKPLEVHGDGMQKRCFCYVEDTVRGTALALENKSAWNQVFNIGNLKTETTIKDLADLVLKVTGGKVPVNLISHEKLFGKYEEVNQRVPDLSKAKNTLGFEAKVGLEDGIRKTFEWQKGLM